MKPVVVYFSRTGNTQSFAEAIAKEVDAPLFSMASSEPSIVEGFDVIILGTPVEGASPAKESRAFVEGIPQGDGKKVILFCTHRLFGNERTMKALEKILDGKGYKTILKVTKKFKKQGEIADFSEALGEVRKALQTQ